MTSRTMRLHANNFRRLVNLPVLHFDPGLTIILGPNGVGKSSLVECFTFLFYGAKAGKLKEIRNDNAAGDFVVEGEVLIDEERIKIRRTSTTAALWINDGLQVQAGPGSIRAVEYRLREMLGGLSREQFERTYIALQGDTAGLVDERSPRERRKIIEGILQIDVLQTALHLQETQQGTQRQRLLTLCEEACRQL
jgi:DNA repair protein SbcC/Rad50